MASPPRARHRAGPRWLSGGGGAGERDVQLRAVVERLVDDAVALGQLEQRGELLVVGVRVQLEAQADVPEADGRLLVDAERAFEVEVALGVDAALGADVQRGRDGLERDAGAGRERL